MFAIPGPSALTAALSVAGLPTDRFVFEGFLPARKAARQKRLSGLVGERRTLVFFESSHRIRETLADIAECLGHGRTVVVCRELTKKFETVMRGEPGQLAEQMDRDPNQLKGEFVVVVEGRAVEPGGAMGEAEELARALLDYLPASQAARVAAKITGVSRREVYRAIEPG